MWGIIHLISWLAIIVCTISALISCSKSDKVYKIIAMINRFFYILVLVSGLMMVPYGFNTKWLLIIFKLLLGITTIGVIEMLLNFRKKQKVMGPLIILFIISILVTIFLGFYLSGGYPLF